MKKIISLILSLIFVLSLTACGNDTKTNNNSSESSGAASNSSENKTDTSSNSKTLVVFYSATGSTKSVAETIAETLNADTFEITPKDPYTSNDLNWSDKNSRVSTEHDDESKRVVPLTKETPDNWEKYDTVYIGYPIWWGIAAWPVNGFIKSNDFTGKTVIPFCTSASSGLGNSDKLLEELAGTGSWSEGKRFSSNASEEDVKKWIN